MRITIVVVALAVCVVLGGCGERATAPAPPPATHAAKPVTPNIPPGTSVALGFDSELLRSRAGFSVPPADADTVRIETVTLPVSSFTATLAFRKDGAWRVETMTQILDPAGKPSGPATKASGRIRASTAREIEALLADSTLFAEAAAADDCAGGLLSQIDVHAGGREWSGTRRCEQGFPSVRLLNLVLGAADTAG